MSALCGQIVVRLVLSPFCHRVLGVSEERSVIREETLIGIIIEHYPILLTGTKI